MHDAATSSALCRQPVPGTQSALASELSGSKWGGSGSSSAPSGKGVGVSRHPLASLLRSVDGWMNGWMSG
jgi:hypothetical protein